MPDHPNRSRDLPDRDAALLAFYLGPVQAFIAGARTIRDLWTGSYLLSWLTFAAMKPILKRHGPRALVSPSLEGNPLLLAFDGELPRELRWQAMTSSLPNHFEAKVPAAGAVDLAEACRASCIDEWKRIAEKVYRRLNAAFHTQCPDWAQNWPQQIDTFFEMKTAVLPLAECGDQVLSDLLHPRPPDDFAAQMALLNTLRDAHRSVRHVPAYRPRPDARGQFPGKCSLLGTLEQVGPADLAASARFWQEQMKTWKDSGWAGSRVGKNERLCAVSLVKRFAWPAYLADKLKLDVREGRFADTATLAAALWLQSDKDKKTAALDPKNVRDNHSTWSGQWLHWRSPQQDEDEDACPPEAWHSICRKREAQGWPPTYYAILMMDGDELGKHLRGVKGAAGFEAISSRLSAFALKDAARIVEHDFHGELIYSGGDDTLALLPTTEVVACARALAHV